MDEIIAVNHGFLVGLEELPQPLLLSGSDLFSGDFGDAVQLCLPDPLVRPLEAAQVEYPVKDSPGFGPELPVDLLFLDDDGVAGFIEPEG